MHAPSCVDVSCASTLAASWLAAPKGVEKAGVEWLRARPAAALCVSLPSSSSSCCRHNRTRGWVLVMLLLMLEGGAGRQIALMPVMVWPSGRSWLRCRNGRAVLGGSHRRVKRQRQSPVPAGRQLQSQGREAQHQ